MTDVTTIDGILEELYTVISGSKDQARDWDRERQLFYPGARLLRTSLDNDGNPKVESMDVETYVLNAGALLSRMDFFEREIHRQIQHFGNFAAVLSTYEARHAPKDPLPFKRGINAIHLYNDGQRWWITHMIWDNERNDLVIPSHLLPD